MLIHHDVYQENLEYDKTESDRKLIYTHIPK